MSMLIYIVKVFIILLIRIWKNMALNESLTLAEKSKLAVWDYPVSDKFTKVPYQYNGLNHVF